MQEEALEYGSSKGLQLLSCLRAMKVNYQDATKTMHSLVHGWVTERFTWIQRQIPPRTGGCMYKLSGNELVLVRTGTHEEVYGK